jgi:hypothetical protein
VGLEAAVTEASERITPLLSVLLQLINRTFRNRSVILAFAGIAFSVAAAIGWLGFRAPTVSFVVDAALIQPELGWAHVVAVPDPGLVYRLDGDLPGDPLGSDLVLLEDGRPLGPPHSQHADIRKHGQGRFSHWAHHIRFAASDNTDPARNGKRYTARATATIATSWVVFGATAFAVGMLLLAQWARLSPSTHAASLRTWFVSASSFTSTPSRVAAFALIAGALGMIGVMFGWSAGGMTQIGMELARFFPLSDAHGYHLCGTQLGAWGNLSWDFCARRILYVSMLSSMLPLLDWSSQNVLLAQGFLVGATTAFAFSQIARIASPVAGALASVTLGLFAWEFTLGVFMTEVPGFVMGALGLGLLLLFNRSSSPLWLFTGFAFLSVGLVSRAGAFFVLPAGLVWVAFLCRSSQRSSWALLVIAAAGATVGPLLQLGEVWALGADATHSGGNFSATLYGLSTGSRQWSEAYDHFRATFSEQGEAAAFKIVYGAAIQNILDHPDVFLRTLAAAFLDYWRTIFDVGILGRWSDALWILLLLGIVHCVFFLRAAPWPSLLLLLFAGEAVSAPFIIDSGGVRVFAATMLIRFALCAIGLQSILHVISRTLGRPQELVQGRETENGVALVGAGLGALVLAFMLFPVLPLSDRVQLEKLSPAGSCGPGLTEVISRTGHETVSITITNDPEPLQSVTPFRIGISRLLDDHRYRASPYAADIKALRPPVTIMRAVDRSSAGGQAITPVAFQGELPASDAPQILCVDTNSFVMISTVKHYLVRNVSPVPSN